MHLCSSNFHYDSRTSLKAGTCNVDSKITQLKLTADANYDMVIRIFYALTSKCFPDSRYCSAHTESSDASPSRARAATPGAGTGA